MNWGGNKMKEDTKGKKKKGRKKKSKFAYYLYAVTVFLLTITNITLAFLLLTQVQSIDVTGTKYSEKNDIVAWIEEDPLTVNSIYTLCKYRFGKHSLPYCPLMSGTGYRGT
jgi:cell division septal protein FtsQ